MEKEQAKTIIQKNFPKLEIESIETAGEGMDSKAFEVNKDLIFRFPKYEKVGKQLQVEISLLPKLQSRLEVTIPHFEYIGKQENGLPFVGYNKIQGVPLEKELFDSFDEELQEKLIEQVASFLKEVNSFSIDEAKGLGVKVANFRENYTSDLAEIKKDAWRLLDAKAKEYIEGLLTSYLSNERNFDYIPTLLHADLSPEHIIYDPEKKSIAGIIDFGDIEIGDPDYDLMYLHEDYSPEFVEKLLKYYPHGDSNHLVTKLDFFSRCNTVHDILIGVNRKDDGLLQWAVNKLKSEI